MYKKRIISLLIINICLLSAFYGCGTTEEVSVSDSQTESYESEEDILRNLPLGESAYLNGYFYGAVGCSTLSLNLVDSKGNIYIPVAERPVSEWGDLLSDNAAIQDGTEYSPVFKFGTDQTALSGSGIIMTGLTYWVDDEGSVIYDPLICGFRFPVRQDGNYATGTSYSEADIQQQDNGGDFLKEYENWIDTVHEEGNIIKSTSTTEWDSILMYSVEYPDHFEIISTGDDSYEIYTWPVGTLDIEIRENEDGKYVIVETRKYYVDREFLEDTEQYNTEIITEQAEKLSLATNSLKNLLEASSLNPVVDETVIYEADMPDELRLLIDEMRTALPPDEE